MVFLSIAARIGRQPAPNDERVRPLQKFNTDRACGSAGHKISVELLGMSTLPPAPLRRSSRHRRTERTNSTRCALSSSSVLSLSNDTAKSDMAGRSVDRLSVARCWAITATVVRCAKMRSTLNHLARNFYMRHARIVAFLFAPTSWALGNAARLRHITFVRRGVPVGGPLPHIADHVVNAVSVWRERIHRRRALIAIFCPVEARKFPLPGIGHVLSSRRELVSPRIFGVFEPAPGSKFPF